MSRRFSSPWSLRSTLQVVALEDRTTPSAFDQAGISALRADAGFADLDGQLPDGGRVGIAILDSGVYGDHPDLRNNFVGFYDAVTKQERSSFDPDGHGTHVAGTAASSNKQIGVAYRASIVGVRVLPADNERFPNHDPITVGLQWVEQNLDRYNLKVVNLSIQNTGVNVNSFGLVPGQFNEWARVIDRLEARGVTVVAASGNNYAVYGAPGSSVPGAVSTLTVANTWWQSIDLSARGGIISGVSGAKFLGVDLAGRPDLLAATSQRSSLANQVAAPGTNIFSTYPAPKLYDTLSGTSMASPMVAGVVAVMQDAAVTYSGKYLTPNAVRDLLIQSGDVFVDSNNPDNRKYASSNGALSDLAETGVTISRVNAHRAAQRLQQELRGRPTPEPGPTPSEDTDAILTKAATVGPLDSARVVTLTGNIGMDGQSLIGGNDVDLFRLEVQSVGDLQIRTDPVSGGTPFDSYLRLFDSTGSLLTENDDRPGSNYSTLGIRVASPGVYYVGVSSFANGTYNPVTGENRVNGESQGDYQLRIELGTPDPNGQFFGAVPFRDTFTLTGFDAETERPGFVRLGSIGTDPNPNDESTRIEVGPGDVDIFAYVVPDNGDLIIRVNSVTGTLDTNTNPFDTYLRVFDESGAEIAFNDDNSTNTDSFLRLAGRQKGERLYLAVSNYDNRGYNQYDPFNRTGEGRGGFYDLFVAFDNKDSNGWAGGAVAGQFDQTVQGRIGADFGVTVGAGGNTTLDVDFFSYTPGSSGVLDVNVAGISGFTPAVTLWTTTNQEGSLIRIGGTTRETSRILAEVTAGQTYYVSVTGRGNEGFDWFVPASGTGGPAGDYTLLTKLSPLSEAIQYRDDSINNHGGVRSVSVGSRISAELGQDFRDNVDVIGSPILVDGVPIYGGADIDIYSLTPTESGRISIRATAVSNVGTTSDPVLRVFDSAGNEIAFNDDASSATRDALVTIEVVAGQTYYIGVTGYSEASRDYNPLTGEGSAAQTLGQGGLYDLIVTEAIANLISPFAVGPGPGGSGVRIFNADQTERPALDPFPGFTGGIRTALVDLNGDGVADLIAGTGPGASNRVRILDGANGNVIADWQPFEASFTSGIFVTAGDINGDSVAEVIVTPDENGGPVVAIYDGARLVSGLSGEAAQLTRFFGIEDPNFRGGARAAIGDVDGDGLGDVLVSAGFGGGPRIALFAGRTVLDPVSSGQLPPKLVADFLAFEESLRNGAFIALGDVTGDGLADLIFGGGPGGGPRVRITDASRLLAGGAFPTLDALGADVANYFAGNESDRSGVRLAVKDLDGDQQADLVTGGNSVRAYTGSTILGNPTPDPFFELDPFASAAGGIFVG